MPADPSLAIASQALLLSMGLTVILFTLTMAQRLGDFRSKRLAYALGVTATILGFSWIYLLCLWIFKLDVRQSLASHWMRSAGTIVFAVVAFLIYIWSRWIGTTPRVDFEALHGGSRGAGYPVKVDDGAPTWVTLKNSSSSVPKIARNTRVRVEWINDAGTRRLEVPEVAWYVMKRLSSGTETTTSWVTEVDLEAGESQSFVLFTTDDHGAVWIRKRHGSLVGILDGGHWEARLTVTSDTAQGFEGKLGLHLSEGVGLVPDSSAFVRQRRLKRNLP